MARNFKIRIKRNNGNLHFHPQGKIDGASAWEMVNLVQSKYRHEEDVFVHTDGVTNILPFASNIIKGKLGAGSVPRKKMIFTGGKGAEIAPSGCQVVDDAEKPLCGCNNGCRNCRCRKEDNEPE
jgi:hypothetical protein